MRAIRTGLQGADIPVENSKGEACAGQEEINIRYDEALTVGDRHAIIKNACKEIAWAKGRALTFLAKWHNDAAGSSSHVHQSLWSLEGEPLFRDPEGQYGMSDTMRHYVAGLLAHADEITYFLAPHINSYKRFKEGTFAPTKAIWSLDNRTAGTASAAREAKRSGWSAELGAQTSTPTWRWPHFLLPASTASKRRWCWRMSSRATPMRRHPPAPFPKPCAVQPMH